MFVPLKLSLSLSLPPNAISGFEVFVVGDPVLLRYDAVSIENQILTFQGNAIP
jgi:hypothetical protein